MRIDATDIPGVLLLEPRLHADSRGFFYESFNQRAFERAVGAEVRFVQDNHSRSARGVLRGLHFQVAPRAQGKLVRVAYGAVFDVAVDLRRESPTFGRWTGTLLSAENRRQLWVPPGLAHGFYVTTDAAEVLYKTTDYYAPDCERTLCWDDPDLAIAWPVKGEPILSEKDRMGIPYRTAVGL